MNLDGGRSIVANDEDSSVSLDDGYVSEFKPPNVKQAIDIVGSYIGDDQCIEWIKGHTIVQKKDQQVPCLRISLAIGKQPQQVFLCHLQQICLPQ